MHEIRRIELSRTMRSVPLDRGSTVLELGCGDNFQLALLRERFGRVFAIDPEAVPCSTGGGGGDRKVYGGSLALP